MKDLVNKYIEKGILEDVQPLIENEKEVGLIAFEPCIGKQWRFFNTNENRKDKIYISPKLIKKYGINKEEAIRKIQKYIPNEVFMTLNHIFVIYRKSDMTYINDYLDKHFENDEGCDDMRNFGSICEEIGKYYGYYDCVIINMKNI